jgi:hypothetical protein
MGSAAKFWPKRLFNFGSRSESEDGFVATTELAAKIIGTKTAESTPLGAQAKPVSSLDDLDLHDLPAPPTQPAQDPDLSRQAERFVPNKTSTTLTDKRGKTVRARIINLSATGVAVEADFRITPVDTVVMVGAKPVKSGRSIRGGHVFTFDKPLDPSRCNASIVL